MPEDEIIWMRPEVTGRGKPPAFTRGQLAVAAITIADAEGIEAVTMRRVAALIGAGTMSLYRYVRNKDELHTLMCDQVVDPYDMPAHLDWKSALHSLADESRALVQRHPWFPALASSVAFPGPRMFRGLEIMMSYLDELGLDVDEMVSIIITVQTFAFGFARNEIAEADAIRRSGLTRDQWEHAQSRYVAHLVDTGDYPYLARIVTEAKTMPSGNNAQFDLAVTRLITGIQATLPARPHPR
jgi:AcrR family transcriptional regulator